MARKSQDSSGTWILIAILAVAAAPIAGFWLLLSRDPDKKVIGIVLLIIWAFIMLCYLIGAAA